MTGALSSPVPSRDAVAHRDHRLPGVLVAQDRRVPCACFRPREARSGPDRQPADCCSARRADRGADPWFGEPHCRRCATPRASRSCSAARSAGSVYRRRGRGRGGGRPHPSSLLGRKPQRPAFLGPHSAAASRRRTALPHSAADWPDSATGIGRNPCAMSYRCKPIMRALGSANDLATYCDKYPAARRASERFVDPTGRSPSSLMCTNR